MIGHLVTSKVNPADRRGRIIRLTADAAVEVDAFQRDSVVAPAPNPAPASTDPGRRPAGEEEMST